MVHNIRENEPKQSPCDECKKQFSCSEYKKCPDWRAWWAESWTRTSMWIRGK